MQWLRSLRPDGDPWSYDLLVEGSVSSPVLLAEAVEELGLQPVAWTVEVSGRATAEVHEREQARGFPSSSTGRARQATERAFLTLLMSMHRGRSAFHSGLSEEFVDIIRADVRHGIPLDALMNRVWSVHTTAKDILVEAIRRVVTAEEHATAMRLISDSAFDFANDFVRQVSAVYLAEERAWRGRRSDTQFRILSTVVAGGEPSPDSDEVLPAHWSGHHVYAVAWLVESGFIEGHESQVGEFAAAVARELGAAGVFTFERDGLTHLWWNVQVTADPPDVTRIRDVPRPSWLRVAVGPAGRGTAGLRDSHLSALQTARMRALDSPVELFLADDVGHLVLMLADPLGAVRFVRRELGGLAADEPRVAEIRDTVRRYLLSGNSRLAVATALHLAPNTVAYRVGQANDLITRPVSERPTTILLALQLLELVPTLLADDA